MSHQIQQVRERAEADFKRLSQSLPTHRDPNYRYTSLKDVNFIRTKTLLQRDLIAPSLDEGESAVLVAEGGKTLLVGKVPAGVYFGSIADAPAEVLRDLALNLPDVFEDDVFAQWVQARWWNDVILFVPDGVEIAPVLRALIRLAPEQDHSLFRVWVRVGRNAGVNFVQEFEGAGLSNGSAPLAVGTIQVFADTGAQLIYSQFQNWGPAVQSFVRESIVAKEYADVRAAAVVTGGSKFQLRTELQCAGEGSRIHARTAARGDEDQHYDFWQTSWHDVPRCFSKMENWTVMADRARAVFNGNIVISERAIGTDAQQRNRNMLLSPRAVIDTCPKLEIATDDVKCAHGAAIVPVNEDQLYYLNARGIPHAEAESMIIDGFTVPVLRELPPGLQTRATKALAQKKGESS